jgi:hypothetical protein
VVRAWAAVAAVAVIACTGCNIRGMLSGEAGSDTTDAESPLEAHDGEADASVAQGDEADAGATTTDASNDTAPDAGAWPPSSADLPPRARHLVEAIAQNSPDLAADILLPREAYMAVRDAKDPAKAWEKSVLLPFRKAVAQQHKKLRHAERARFVSLELGPQLTEVPAKRKEWKEPLWRVRHSKLSFSIDGKVHRLDVAEMIGFRGSWYVSKLR